MKNYLVGAFLGITLYLPAVHLSADSKSSKTENDVAAELGWISVPSTENICCGYYLDPLADFGNKPLPPITTTPVTINADTATFHQTGTSILIGKITLSQPGRLVNADKIYLNRTPDAAIPGSADLYGNVMLREPGKLIIGDSAHLELHSKVANFKNAIYRLVLSTPDKVATTVKTEPVLTAWGKAKVVNQDQKGVITLLKSSYTTCAPTANTWLMNAQKVLLNRDTGRGTAYGAWLDVQGVPVFYMPYFNFPIDKRRQTGFLFPTIGNSSVSGFNFTTPFYWNIAPNYDALITPHYYSERGLQMSADFRYLTENSSGDFYGSFLPNDDAFETFKQDAVTKYASFVNLGRLEHSNDDRYAYAWHDNTTFNEHWNTGVNYNSVSDDYYFEDFGNTPQLNNQISNQLPREVHANYVDEYWHFNGIVQTYQTLHPVNQAAVNNPYGELPQLTLNGSFPDQAYGLEYLVDNQFTYFMRAHNPGETTTVPSAGRFNFEPGVKLPIIGLSGYFTPELQLALTHYNVGSQVEGYNSVIQRNIPIFNIDTGLFFDRSTHLFNTDYQQTLEPRLFYLYVPYRNQNDIPVFDTGIVPFTYDSLYMTNRFSSLDRIGDANQISYGFTTRFLQQDDGTEKFRTSVGQIYYFRNRRVNLCDPGAAAGTTPSTASTYTACNANPTIAVGATSPTEKFSPVAGQVAYNFNPAWNLTGNVAWDPTTNETINAGANLQYHPMFNHVINFNYNFVRYGDGDTAPPNEPPIDPQSWRNDLNQAGTSFAWPIVERWSAVGGYTYNISHKYSQSYFGGVEYNSCCWAVRMVAGRTFVGLNQNYNPTFNNNVYLQFQFKGLANVGTQDPATFLMGNIPGYQDTFQPFSGTTL